MKFFLKLNKWRVTNAILFLVCVTSYVGTELYWNSVCHGGGCNLNFIDSFLSPVNVMGLFLAITFLIFLFLPQAYFKRYFTHWFWWLFLIAFVIAAATEPIAGSMIGFDRDGVVQGLGVILLVHALLFSGVTYYKNR